MDKAHRARDRDSKPAGRRPRRRRSIFSDPAGRGRRVGLVYLGFRSLLADNRTARGLPGGGPERRHEPPLARGVRAIAPDVRSEGSRRPDAGSRARQGLRGLKDDDPRVRRYLAHGHRPSRSAAPAQAVADLSRSARRFGQRGANQRHLGAWARRATRRSSPTLQPLYESDDPGIRKMVVYALGALPGTANS